MTRGTAWCRLPLGTSVGAYQYDGRNFRIVKNTYTSGVLSENRHFYFTNDWRDIEERIGTSTSMDLQYVWGIRYTDELVCRDDATPQRLYAAQDANFNLTSVSDTSGSVVERYLFDPYGGRTIMSASWTSTDPSAYAWEIGHQGLTHALSIVLIYNRARHFHSGVGIFGIRDPQNYLDGANLYGYEGCNPGNRTDPSGLNAAAKAYAVAQVASEQASHSGHVYYAPAGVKAFFVPIKAIVNTIDINWKWGGKHSGNVLSISKFNVHPDKCGADHDCA